MKTIAMVIVTLRRKTDPDGVLNNCSPPPPPNIPPKPPALADCIRITNINNNAAIMCRINRIVCIKRYLLKYVWNRGFSLVPKEPTVGK